MQPFTVTSEQARQEYCRRACARRPQSNIISPEFEHCVERASRRGGKRVVAGTHAASKRLGHMMPTKKRSDVNAEDEMPRITRGVFCTSAVHSFLYHVNKHVLVKTRSYCTITVAEQIRFVHV